MEREREEKHHEFMTEYRKSRGRDDDDVTRASIYLLHNNNNKSVASPSRKTVGASVHLRMTKSGHAVGNHARKCSVSIYVTKSQERI